VTDHPDSGITPGVVVYRIQDRVFFANAHFFERRLWAAVDGAPEPVRQVVPGTSSVTADRAEVAVVAGSEVEVVIPDRCAILVSPSRDATSQHRGWSKDVDDVMSQG
jgi:hypothetical protein